MGGEAGARGFNELLFFNKLFSELQALKKLLKAMPPIPNVQFFKKCRLLLTEAFFNKKSLNSFIFLFITKHGLRIHLNSLLRL